VKPVRAHQINNLGGTGFVSPAGILLLSGSADRARDDDGDERPTSVGQDKDAPYASHPIRNDEISLSGKSWLLAVPRRIRARAVTTVEKRTAVRTLALGR